MNRVIFTFILIFILIDSNINAQNREHIVHFESYCNDVEYKGSLSYDLLRAVDFKSIPTRERNSFRLLPSDGALILKMKNQGKSVLRCENVILNNSDVHNILLNPNSNNSPWIISVEAKEIGDTVFCKGYDLKIFYEIITKETLPPSSIVEKQNKAPLKKVDTERLEWKRVKASNRISDLYSFLKKYPTTKYRKRVKERIFGLTPMKIEIEKSNGNHIITIWDVSIEPEINIPVNVEIVEPFSKNEIEQNYKIVLKVLDAIEPVINICSPKKILLPENERCKSPPLIRDVLDAVIYQTDDSLEIHFTGGFPPYQVAFIDENDRFVFHPSFEESNLFVTNMDLHNLGGAAVYKKLEIRDSSKSYSKTFLLEDIHVEEWNISDSLNANKESIFCGLGLLLLLLFSRKIGKNIKRKKEEEKRKKVIEKLGEEGDNENDSSREVVPKADLKEMAITQDGSEDESNKEDNKVLNEEHGNIPSKDKSKYDLNEYQPLLNNRKEKTYKNKIKILGKKKEGARMLKNVLEGGNFYEIELTGTWKNTAVKKIHISRDSIFELNDFLRKNNISKIKENENEIPEIGGMLLGAADFSKGGWEVSIDKFVPIKSVEENVYKLEFDSQNIANELSDFMESHPGYLLVGWFHTHPGHGLFLSRSDLRIHKGHFIKPYQFAMEIDSLSENLDTAFFTWRKELSDMNNFKDRLEENWLSWIEIEKFTRKNII